MESTRQTLSEAAMGAPRDPVQSEPRLRSIWRHVRLYYWYLRANWLSLWVYPVPFVMMNVAGVAYALGSVAAVWVLFSKIHAIGGWTLPEVMLIYGLSIFSRSLFHLFWVELMNTSAMVKAGDIDRLLVRPLNPLYQLVAGYLDNDDWGELLTAIILVWTSLGMLGQRTIANVLWCLVASVSGSIIFASIHCVCNAFAFFTVESRGMTDLAWTTDEFTRYPADIYGKGVRAVITWVIPVAFASFYPAQVILGEGRLRLMGLLSPFVAIACFAFAYWFWGRAMDKYQGVGN